MSDSYKPAFVDGTAAQKLKASSECTHEVWNGFWLLVRANLCQQDCLSAVAVGSLSDEVITAPQ